MKKGTDKHEGYEIGSGVELIQIHGHINDPDYWFITIRRLIIFGDRLCKKTCTEEEIARYVNAKLKETLYVVQTMIKNTVPFTGKQDEKTDE